MRFQSGIWETRCSSARVVVDTGHRRGVEKWPIVLGVAAPLRCHRFGARCTRGSLALHIDPRPRVTAPKPAVRYSTVTVLARFRGWSMWQPRMSAMW